MRLPLRILIFTTIGVSLAASLLPDFQSWLALSRSGIAHFYLWQLLTYPFVESQFFSLSYLIDVGFNMYILWLFGHSLLERCDSKLFLILYFGATLVGGLAGVAASPMQLAGSSGPVYGVMTAWMMLNAHSQLLLFFKIPMKAFWLVFALIFVSLGADVMTGNWVEAASLSASVLFGYLFALIVWKEQGPFTILRPFERKILGLFDKKPKNSYPSKIYDFQSGDPILNDEQFMDAMLEKISRTGADSLTAEEKARMQQISKKRK